MKTPLLASNSPNNHFCFFINQYTHCDDIAEGIIAYKKNKKISIPVVVRMIGTNEQQGKSMLEKNGITAIDNMEKGAKKIVSLVK